jgi:hypothetical protein
VNRPPSPYLATCGPEDGPARPMELPSPIGVHVAGEDGRPGRLPVGMAFGAGRAMTERWGPVEAWRLVIGKAEVPERFVLEGRRFVPVNPANDYDSL